MSQLAWTHQHHQFIFYKDVTQQLPSHPLQMRADLIFFAHKDMNYFIQ